MKKLLASGLATVLCASGATAFAGEEYGAEKPEMYCVYREIVKPAMMEQYEAAVKQMIAEFKAYQIDPEKVHWKTIYGPEMGYNFVMPLESWAGMDKMHANWEEAIQTIGKDKFEDMMAPAEEAIEKVQVFHVIRRSDLSYEPENPRLAEDEIGYVHYGFYYVLPGKQKEIEAIAKQFVDLYRRKGIDTGWSIYQAVTGDDLPLLVVAHGAESETDFYTTRERLHEQLGEEAEKLGKKVYDTIRGSEYRDGYVRRDLAYPGPNMVPAGESHEGHAHEGHGH